VQAMVAGSDGTASDVLLRLVGGPSAVQEYLAGLGITNVVVATTERTMGEDELAQYRNWATPEGMQALLLALHQGKGLSAESRSRLRRHLTETTSGPGRIKGRLPAGTPVAHKTGTSRTIDGLTRATNDAGLIRLPDGRHLVVVVFVADSRADAITREAVIARAARAAWDFWQAM
jgi:beta-lactamase class A